MSDSAADYRDEFRLKCDELQTHIDEQERRLSQYRDLVQELTKDRDDFKSKLERSESERQFAQGRMENQLNQKYELKLLIEEAYNASHLRREDHREWFEKVGKLLGK